MHKHIRHYRKAPSAVMVHLASEVGMTATVQKDARAGLKPAWTALMGSPQKTQATSKERTTGGGSVWNAEAKGVAALIRAPMFAIIAHTTEYPAELRKRAQEVHDEGRFLHIVFFPGNGKMGIHVFVYYARGPTQ